jgi:hypothetical protein
MTPLAVQRQQMSDHIIRTALDTVRIEARLRDVASDAIERAAAVAAWCSGRLALMHDRARGEPQPPLQRWGSVVQGAMIPGSVVHAQDVPRDKWGEADWPAPRVVREL